MTKVLIVAGLAQSLVGFRGPLLRAMRAGGHEVVACAAGDDLTTAAQLATWGISYAGLSLQAQGLNPWKDRAYILALRHLMRREQPEVVLAYTHKPVIYSALAASKLASGPRVFGLITGLGYAFIENRTAKQIIAGGMVRFLYRWASRYFAGAIFQNPDDQALFRRLRLIPAGIPQSVVRGSGIDLKEFPFVPLDESGDQTSTKQGKTPHFLLIARLLGDKGIREYALAARQVRKTFPAVEFHLVGPRDLNPTAIPAAEVEGWEREGIIVYHGSQLDVRPFLRDCGVFVLPSYREGTPRTVLEAMATGRPVITTDTAGCRETVFDAGSPDASGTKQGRNGFLVPVKSVEGLVSAMLAILNHPHLATAMGTAGRDLVEKYYNVDDVNRQMLKFMGLTPGTRK